MKILEVKTEKRLLGDFGEKCAIKHLRRKGYKILESNYVAKDSEIDIIAENRSTVAFIEVKTRNLESMSTVEDRPASAVTKEKQRKIIAAAKYYIGGKSFEKHHSLDIIEVYVSGDKGNYKAEKIVHIENAFNINTAYERYGKGRP